MRQRADALGVGYINGVVAAGDRAIVSGSGGIARIASFITVGVLLLLVDWFAPVPHKVVENEEDKA